MIEKHTPRAVMPDSGLLIVEPFLLVNTCLRESFKFCTRAHDKRGCILAW